MSPIEKIIIGGAVIVVALILYIALRLGSDDDDQ